MFNIGDKVFKGNYSRLEKWITCPDCLGSKRVKMILGDASEVIIECGGCDPGGYQPSIGLVRQYEYGIEVKSYIVTGVRQNTEKVEYELNCSDGSCCIGYPKDTFSTEEEALAAAEVGRKEAEAEENKRWLAKTKDHRSWKWNAAYHRRCIKDLERQLEFHRGKVQVCAAKAKEEA